MRALLDAGHAVNSARELDEVLQTILNQAVGLLEASTGSVMLRDGDELVVVAASGNPLALHERVHVGAGISGVVAGSRRPQLVTGPASASRFPGLPTKLQPPECGMSVPMVDREELVGVLNVGVSGGRVYKDDDLRLLCGFGELAATAIAKTRLYETARRATAELAYSATHDALTSLANRTLLAERITGAFRDEVVPSQGALLFIDIDDFKSVNDVHGHAVGDDVLRVVSGRLRSVCPVGGTPARVGGDELALWAPDVVDGREAEAIAARMVDSARARMTIDGDEAQVTVSVGIALAGRHGSTYAELMSAADRALYDAKRAGKNCWRMTNADHNDQMSRRVPRPRERETQASGGARVGL